MTDVIAVIEDLRDSYKEVKLINWNQAFYTLTSYDI